jgi:hypothetical protein
MEPMEPPRTGRRAWVLVLVASLGFLAAWESQSRYLLPRIPQPDDWTFKLASAPVTSHVDGSVRFVAGRHEVLRLDPDGTCYVDSRLVANDAAVLDGFRAFLAGATHTDSVGRVTTFSDHTTYSNFTIESGAPGLEKDGEDVNMVNVGEDFLDPTTTFTLPESEPSMVREALRHLPPAGYVFDHVTRVSDGPCVIHWKKAP